MFYRHTLSKYKPSRPLIVLMAVLLFALLTLSACGSWLQAPAGGWYKFFFNDNDVMGNRNNNNITTTQTTLPVLVNELLAHTDPPQKDTVELYNPNNQAVDISGWYLTDALDEPQKFKIPANTVIPAQGYALFDPEVFGITTRFVFSAEGEEIYLFAADAGGQLTGYYHGFHFGASPNGISLGRYVTSTGKEEFPIQSALTLGAANAGPKIGPVVISEILYHPNSSDEYIELTNITAETVPLYDPVVPTNTWHLLGIGDYVLPPNLSLAPAATLLIVPIEPDVFRTTYGITADVQIIGPYPTQLPDTSAKLSLQSPDPVNLDGFVPYVEVDVVEYDNTAPWPSPAADQGLALQRVDHAAYGNDPANWTSKNMTLTQ